MLPREDMLYPGSNVFAQQVPIMKVPFDPAMAFLWLTIRGNTREQQIEAG